MAKIFDGFFLLIVVFLWIGIFATKNQFIIKMSGFIQRKKHSYYMDCNNFFLLGGDLDVEKKYFIF